MRRRQFLGRVSSQGTAREGHFPLGDSGMPVAAHPAPVRFGAGSLSGVSWLGHIYQPSSQPLPRELSMYPFHPKVCLGFLAH